MNRTSALLLTTALAASLTAGCGGDSSPASGPSIADASAAELAALCASLSSCPPGPFTFSSPAACLAYFNPTGSLDLGETNALISSGKTTYNAGNVAACTAALSASCNALFGKTPAACTAVLTGTLAAGAGCDQDSVCASGFCKLPGHGCGVCTAKADAGGACTTDTGCSGSLVCVYQVCTAVPTPTLGQSCNSGVPCAAGLYCDSGNGYVCKTQLAAGASCTPSQNACQAGLVCGTDPTSSASTCVTIAKLGQACTLRDQCYGYDTACINGHCAALPGKGAACTNTGSSTDCTPPYACGATSHVCGLPTTGEACPNFACDGLSTCTVNNTGTVCVARLAAGASCASDYSGTACVDGLTCVKGHCAAPVTCEP